MQNASHRIRRQKWLVHTSSTEDAFAWRKLLRDKGQDILLPVLEKAFDEAGKGDRVIYIPRIELKVKIDAEKQVSEALFNQIIQQLREQLQHLLQEQAQSTRQHLIRKESTTQKDRFETLLYYLRTGSVPWQEANASAQEIAIALTETCREEWLQLLDYVLKNHESASFFFRLLQLISEEQFSSLICALSDRIPQGVRPAVIQCITGLFHSAKTIFSRYTRIRLAAGILSESIRWRESAVAPCLFHVAVDAVPQEERHVFYDFISSLPADAAALFQQKKPDSLHGQAQSTRQHLVCKESTTQKDRFEALLYYLRTGLVPRQEANASAHEIEDALTKTCREEWMQLLDYVLNNHESASFFFRLLQLISEDQFSSLICALSDRIPQGVSPAVIQCITGLFHSEKTNFNRHTQIRLAAGILSESVRWRESAIAPGFFPVAVDAVLPEEDLFPCMVHQAGLVLLHPFITRFFENTGIIKTGDMQLSSFSLARAATLLHFLATGREEAYEYELGFIKILLGVHPESPLPVCEGLVKSCDKEESESLLQSVIKHWSVLKNTSVNGLRSTFLQRQALLREDENGWKLHVERAPFDVLLDQLPWNISIVKLPWMEKALYTEW